MHKLYLFNPENDLALAADVDRYTAPAAARRLRADLSLLPMWIASPGDCVLADDTTVNQNFIDSLSGRLTAPDGVGIYRGGIFQPIPWGWSRSVRGEFQRMGLCCDADDALLCRLRELSSRRTTVEMLRRLADDGVDVPAMPVVCHSLEAVRAAVSQFGSAVLKMPWSSSGRGVCRVESAEFDKYENWASGIIRRQGEALCEPFLDKVQDFAMEFYATGGEVALVGYSVFFNTPQMSYDHAVVASTERLRHRLSALVGADVLLTIRQSVAKALSQLLPDGYDGYVGVDMMAYRDRRGALRVDPCVEVNLRATMGVVSASLGDRVLHPGCEATMRVLYHKDAAALTAFVQTLRPPHFADGRLTGGTLMLAPVTPQSRYTATLTVS